MVRKWSLPNYFASKTQKISLLFFLAACTKKFQQANVTDITWDGNDPPDDWLKTGWARDPQTRTRLVDSLIVSRACSKTMHSLSCITSGLPYITLCYIDSIFFPPLEQLRTALLGCRLVFARLLAGNKSTRNVTKYSLKGPCVLLFCEVKLFTLDLWQTTSAYTSKLYVYNTSMGNSKFNVSNASKLLFPDFLIAKNMVRVIGRKIIYK